MSHFALAIHGGAGAIPKSLSRAKTQAFTEALRRITTAGRGRLAGGMSALDCVEAVVRDLEDEPLFNAGRGAVLHSEGDVELDASIMDGGSHQTGAISGVTRVKNPISLARLVMDRTPHVFLQGRGAEEFALQMEVPHGEKDYFVLPIREEQLAKAKTRGDLASEFDDDDDDGDDPAVGTVGCVARDIHGGLAAATSTGGRTNKMVGRVGDTPIIGAGTYACNLSCAVSATGKGEEFVRFTVARDIAAWMEIGKVDLDTACQKVLEKRLKPGDGGVIAVDSSGHLALVFNSEGMHRGWADSKTEAQVAIW